MYCRYCGEKLPDYAKFCGRCGKPVNDGAQAAPAPKANQGTESFARAAKSLATHSKSLFGKIAARVRAFHWHDSRRIRPALFGLLSLLLISTGWLVPTGETRQALNTLQTKSWEIVDQVERVADFFGVQMDTEFLYELVWNLSEGKLEPYGVCTAVQKAVPTIRSLRREFGDVDDSLNSGLGTALTIAYIYILAFWVSIASGFMTIIARLAGKEFRINRLFFVMQILLMIYFIGICYFIEELSGGFLVRPTLTALLSVIFAALSGDREPVDWSIY